METVGEIVVLDKSRMWPGIAVPAATMVVLGSVAVVTGFTFGYGFIFLAAALSMAVFRRNNAILADDEGLLLRERGKLTRSWRWTEIDRLGWAAWGYWGARLVVHPHGGPYDVPGPNSPVRVGHVWNPRRVGPDPLQPLMTRHGIRPLPEQ